MIVVATGFFDGVHNGHKKVLSFLYNTAKAEGKESAVVTFWPHPRSVLQQQADNLQLLNSIDEKMNLVKGEGIDKVITIPFNKEFSKLTTKEFLRDILRNKYGVSTLIIGYDHRFGHDTITQEELIIIANSLGIRVVRVEKFEQDNLVISSTKIRNLLKEGSVELASELLGYRYGLKGIVVSGEKVGRTIGFPTANMKLYDPFKILPADGVYGVYVEVLDKTYIGICNIGTRPTVGDNNERTIETHILNFNEDIYGLDIKIEFAIKIRDERRFDSLEFLKEQLSKDKTYAQRALESRIVSKLR